MSLQVFIVSIIANFILDVMAYVMRLHDILCHIMYQDVFRQLPCYLFAKVAPLGQKTQDFVLFSISAFTMLTLQVNTLCQAFLCSLVQFFRLLHQTQQVLLFHDEVF